ncbi:MAG: hypothetical protein A2846_03760 [Candidatus Doudnabacteria bacterium RIFCSPHIGHO2_01_FULL_49_9]|uniref:Glucose/Sorbosone dehydrogenase domain-containing protein n=2 Tax=Bacteria candidate phyla TaxID=1783234 RepID=A0A1F5NZV1_9BACT|nr:MAG: hypothetical protein A2846_03760 [Candidatus Doudnabacteria bacterium RIFCSPHIGHO2_01_FULL_49_9]
MRIKTVLLLMLGAIVAAFAFNRGGEQENTIILPPPDNVPAETVKVIAENLEIPWDMAFLPGGEILVTERPGRLSRLAADGSLTAIPIDGIKKTGEGGLLGLMLHPKFAENKFLYIYLSSPGIDEPTQNSVVRYKLTADKLSDKKVIISGIPGAIYHDGGRMEFGPDGMLYVTTGDATTPALAQNPESLAGKILRLNDDGSIPKDNPFGTAVYSYGHRNPQGLAWDASGKLWETEHGRSGALSGLDELNLIKKGANYGWPEIEGDKAKSSMTIPALHSGPDVTWAPASLAYLDGYLYFGGLRGESLYRAKVDREKISGYQAFFKGEFGRIRTVRVGPDGMLYLTTSNRDGRGAPKANDDKIIRIDPSGL